MLRLPRDGDDLVWEATWNGCLVEVALGPSSGDDGACQVETLEFESPRTAREYVDEEIERLIGQGFELQREEASPPPPEKRRPAAVDLGRVFRIEPHRSENREMLAAIQANPDDDAAYLVYADWLQEQGDPRGELIAIQHGARRSHELHRVAARVVQHFKDLLLPAGCDSDSVRLRWRLGFIEGARVHSVGELLDHPSGQVLRELSADAEAFCRAMAANRPLPCLEVLKLKHVTSADAKRIRSVLESSQLPVLRQLSLRYAEDLGEVLAPVVASGRLPDLDVVDVACDQLHDDRRLRWLIKKCSSIPAARRPRLCLTLPEYVHDDEFSSDCDPEALASLRQTFVCIEPEDLPHSFALEEDRRHETHDDDEYASDDILDRICGGCGGAMDDPDGDGICPACGHSWDEDYADEQGWVEFLGLDDNDEDEVCLHDASRDPSQAPRAKDADAKDVDQRWETFKDDVFDIDDA